MALVLTRAPSVEPVSLVEAKAHLRLDSTDEDGLVSGLIETSRLSVEAALGLGLISQDWLWVRDRWPADGCLQLPLTPVMALLGVDVTSQSGVVTPIDPADFLFDRLGRPARLVPKAGGWPPVERTIDGISIRFTVGFGATAAEVPAPIRQAILLLVAHWFENREPLPPGERAAPVPNALDALLRQYREARL